jgi:hypothetical protein
LDISDDGTIKIASASGESIASDHEVRQIYDGAFVNFSGSRDGLVQPARAAAGPDDRRRSSCSASTHTARSACR